MSNGATSSPAGHLFDRSMPTSISREQKRARIAPADDPSAGPFNDQSASVAGDRSGFVASNPALLQGGLDCQKGYRTFIAELVALAKLPTTITEAEPWRRFFGTFVPGLYLYSQTAVTTSIIPGRASELTADVKSRLVRTTGSLLLDRWTGPDHRYYLGFALEVKLRGHEDRGLVRFVDVVDTTAEAQTAANQLQHVLRVLGNPTGPAHWVKVVSVVTGGGEMANLRRELKVARPDLHTGPCFAHQADLLALGLLTSGDGSLLAAVKQADRLIAWLRSRIRHLSDVEEPHLRRPSATRLLVFLHACDTRWPSYYVAYTRLLVLRQSLHRIVTVESRLDPMSTARVLTSLAKDTSAQDRIVEAVTTISDAGFWEKLARAVHFLQPIAIASMRVRSDHAPLHEVMTSLFGALFRHFSAPEYQNDVLAIGFLRQLQDLYVDCDPGLLFAATVLYPTIGLAPFNQHNFNCSDAARIVADVAKRHFGICLDQSRYALTMLILDITDRIGMWDFLSTGQSYGLAPLQMYQAVQLDLVQPAIYDVVERIFSAAPNTVPVKRLFSHLAGILSDKRSSMSSTLLKALLTIKMAKPAQDSHPDAATLPAASASSSASCSGSASSASGPPAPSSRAGCSKCSEFGSDDDLDGPLDALCGALGVQRPDGENAPTADPEGAMRVPVPTTDSDASFASQPPAWTTTTGYCSSRFRVSPLVGVQSLRYALDCQSPYWSQRSVDEEAAVGEKDRDEMAQILALLTDRVKG